MLYLTVGLHIIAPGKLLPTDGTRVTLGPVNVGVVPAIGHGFVAIYATIKGGKGARQLDKQCRIVNVVITS